MRNLLAENLEKAATKRTVAAITERSASDANADVAEAEAESRPTETVQVQGALQVASAAEPVTMSPARSTPPPSRSVITNATAAVPPAQTKSEQTKAEQVKAEPAPLTSGVIQTEAISAIPGSSEPMKPVRVKTVQVKAGQTKLAAAGPPQPATPITNAVPAERPEVPETSSSVVAKAEVNKTEVARTEMPPQPANHGTGNGILGVLPASSVPPAPASQQAMAYADPAPRPQPQPQTVQQNGAIRPVTAHTGWIIQVGALESEGEAQQRIEAARSKASALLSKADPFTEPVMTKDRRLFRARFAGLDRDQAEAVCRTLKRSDISCITVRN
jgi:D-alanyl-D-alanine carboxypeptidase